MKLRHALPSLTLLTTALASPLLNRELVGSVPPVTAAPAAQPPPLPPSKGLNPQVSNQTAVIYSENWAGAAYSTAPSGAHFTSVTGTFTVPQPQPPTSEAGSWYGCAWVGIDGNTNPDALLQGGVSWGVSRSSSGALSYSYDPWIEYLPNAMVNLNDFPITSGDVVTVTCTATSNTSGECAYINHSNGASTTTTASAPNPTNTLTGINAEWIVEDYYEDSGYVPFANFGTVIIQNASASDNTGNIHGLQDASLVSMQSESGKIEAQASISDTSVTVNYV